MRFTFLLSSLLQRPWESCSPAACFMLIPARPTAVSNNKWFAGTLLGLAAMGFLITLFVREAFGVGAVPLSEERFTMVNRFGIALMTDYLLPFEAAGLLLLITLVGAAVIAATQNKNSIS
ncbi:MAG: NADH-quinone oxidoreductase subunit J [Cyclobacteriaceae bacterium]|nr:NADH-quinone oxidoreductase subunit J [Cyclobacteriaceae bacterium]